MATTPAKQSCPVCGTLLPDDGEFCPVCVLRQAVETQTEPVSDSGTSELRFEHYTVLTNAEGKPFELGRGAMGVTYKAFDVHLQCPVALKIINAQLFSDASARHRFIREARAAASVRHPNVASVFHLGEAGGNYFYAMELVDGEPLESLIRRSGKLETDLALEVVTQVASGLTAVQKQHLVHRDIKPSNIMVNLQDGRLENVKIIDLGLAKGVAEENTISTLGAFIGTPAYASPEQFAGIGTDIRSDLYSLGIMLWEMLTGDLPFHGSAAELMYQHQHAELPSEKLKTVPLPVATLLQVLLEKDPGARLQSPTELLTALIQVKRAIVTPSGLTIVDLRTPAGQPAGESPRRTRKKTITRWLVVAAGSVATLLIAGFFFIGRQESFFSRWNAKPPASEKSIAVLPFESLSENPGDTYFADGVQDEILNKLAKIAELKVISRTSVMQYRPDAKRDLRQIAGALAVGSVLEGTVRRDGSHVRVTTELIDARDDKTMWADSYDRDLTDIFAIQSEIAQTIASKLIATLTPEEKKSIDTPPTDNLEAYDLYLRARELITSVGATPIVGDLPKKLDEAISFLDQAVRLDPKFALAYCASAVANAKVYDVADRSLERRELADKAMNSVLQLQTDLPEVHLTYASYLYWVYRDYERARVQLTMAIRGLPNDAHALALAAYMDRRQGHFDQAIQDFKESIARDPHNPEVISEFANTFFILRKFSAAEDAYERAIQLAPDDPMLRVQRGYLILREKGQDTALRLALRELPASMENVHSVLCWRLRCALDSHEWQQAKQLIEKLDGGEDDGNFAFPLMPVPVGCYTILLARLQGQPPTASIAFVQTREQLDEKVKRSPANSVLLAKLALVDALLGNKDAAISEAKSAVEMLPISKDALLGPEVALILGLVYAWTDEFDLAFQTLRSLAKVPNGLYYGDLKFSCCFEPFHKDPRYEQLLAQLAATD